MFESLTIFAIAISSFFGGSFEDMKGFIVEPLVIEQTIEDEFICQDDMPCANPEFRVSWSDDIVWCGDNYNVAGYYEEFSGCLDEVRDYWTTLHA